MPPRLDEILKSASQSMGSQPVTLGDVFALHGRATQGALLVMLAVPCLLPLPGAGTVMSVGIAGMAVSIWRGEQNCNLPSRVAGLQLSSTSAHKVLCALAWFYVQAANWTRTRMTWLTEPIQRRWLAAWVAAMAVLIFLPIPFGNVLPAMGLLLSGLGLVYRDGLAVMLGVATGLVALVLTTVLGFWAWELGAMGFQGLSPF